MRKFNKQIEVDMMYFNLFILGKITSKLYSRYLKKIYKSKKPVLKACGGLSMTGCNSGELCLV